LSADLGKILFQDSLLGQLAWEIFGGTLLYAADLVPEIADDIVNVDNAIKWGFNWIYGPFEMLDYLGPERVIARLESENTSLPRMLLALKESGGENFYDHSTNSYLSAEGKYVPIQ
jgi:3-hydroxyacyl-CoA dehydrogenase